MTDPARSAAPERRPSVTLAMIVKDEAAVIERCLASVRALIDAWVVVDTGSTDATPQIIEAALAGVPGRLEHRPWVDFGHNRSELMALAQGVGDHLLLLDADQTVRVEGELPPLVAEAHLVRHDGDPEYWVPRLVRADRLWRFEGATHEHLATDGAHTQARLHAWVIEHHADGGSRADKFTRDRTLLEAELARRPDDPRATFYLAQTLRDLGEVDGAVARYRHRVALGGWHEEVFYSRYQEGELLADRDWDAAVDALLDAHQIHPGRAEPLLALARGYRTRGRHGLARHFAALGLTVPEPTDDLLFVHLDAYRWALRFEYAIVAYHCGDPRSALEANERLLCDGVPAWVEPWVAHNRAWCRLALGLADRDDRARLPQLAEPLPLLTDLVGWSRRADIALEVPAGWSTLNPSVAADPTGDGLVALVRTVNYRFGPGGGYEIADPDGGTAIRTVNHLVALGDDLSVVADGGPLTAVPSGPPTVAASQVVGVEDARLVAYDGRWWGLGTVRDRNEHLRCEMALVDIGPLPARAEEPARGATATVMVGPGADRHQKNWMPFVDGDHLLALHTCDPTVVVELGGSDVVESPTGGSSSAPVVSSRPGPPGAGSFRGGSPGLAVADGAWLFVVHEVVPGGELGRIYGHRLLRVIRDGGADGSGYVIEAVSAPFALQGPDIEFCAGLALTGGGGRAVLSYGHRDDVACLLEVPTADLLGLLVPIRS